MNLIRTTIFILFATIMISCADEDKSDQEPTPVKDNKDVKPMQENKDAPPVQDNKDEKVDRTEDGRIILSLTAIDDPSLVIPEGRCTGCTISKRKLGRLIADEFDSISDVYHLYMSKKLYPDEIIPIGQKKTTSTDSR